ncbi:MAG: restriction endonuclease [Candidatus Altiarchaeia archaeon]
MDDDFDQFWNELEKEKLLGIDPETLKKVLAKLLKESSLELKSVSEAEQKSLISSAAESPGDLVVISTDKLGKEVKSLVRIEKGSTAIEKDDIEDLYSDMIDSGSLNALFLTNSYYTKEAKEFAQGTPLRLVDRKELSDIVYEIESVTLQRAFVSEIGDQYVTNYFRVKLKNKLTNIILKLKDTINEIDRRYMPIGFFTVKKIQETVEKREHAYIDLTSGELYYIDEGKLMKSDVVKKILELPLDAKKTMLELMEQGALPLDHMGGKSLDILAKKGLVMVYDQKKTGGLIKEFFSIFSFIVAEVTEPLIRRGEMGPGMTTTTNKFVSPQIKVPPFDHPYNLEYFMEVTSASETYEPDQLRYKPEEVADVLSKMTGGEVKYNYNVYFPYYLCKYSGPQGVKYERISSPKFKDFFPKASEYNTFYHIIDKFPDLPYLILAFLYIGYVSYSRTELAKLTHIFSSTLLYVALALAVGIVLKGIFRTQRTTPFYATQDYGIKVFRYGFPSLHSLASCGAVSFCYFINPLGPLLSVLMIPIAITYIYSRLRIGAHSKTDVVGGAIIGFFVGVIAGVLILGTKLPDMLEMVLSFLMIAGLVGSILARLKYMH